MKYNILLLKFETQFKIKGPENKGTLECQESIGLTKEINSKGLGLVGKR